MKTNNDLFPELGVTAEFFSDDEIKLYQAIKRKPLTYRDLQVRTKIKNPQRYIKSLINKGIKIKKGKKQLENVCFSVYYVEK